VTLRTRVVDENRKLLDRGADEVRHET
jgi:hypothetical protein